MRPAAGAQAECLRYVGRKFFIAALYGVETGQLNRAVKRNSERFPADLMFRLTDEEADALRRQFGLLKRIPGRREISPICFHAGRFDYSTPQMGAR